MRRLLLFAFFVFSAYSGIAQVSPVNGEPFADVSEMPHFPGGEDSLKAYLHRNIEYFFEYHLINFSGNAYVSFTVDKNGKVKDTKVLQTSGYAKIDNEVIRVFNKMPTWVPGKDEGKPVDVYMYLTVDIYPEY